MVEGSTVTASFTSVHGSDVGTVFDVVVGHVVWYDECSVVVGHTSSGDGDENIKSNGDGDDSDKPNKSTIVTEVSKVFASSCGVLLSFVSGGIDSTALSDESRTGVTSSIREKIQEDVECK